MIQQTANLLTSFDVKVGWLISRWLHHLNNFFLGWKLDASVPTVIYVAYLLQISFYVHSVYATLFIDLWRKDSVVMMIHHFVTLFLTIFSYIFR